MPTMPHTIVMRIKAHVTRPLDRAKYQVIFASMAQLPFVVVCADVPELDEAVELVELAALVAAVGVAVASSVESSSLDFVAAAVVAWAATCVVAVGWSATIAPLMVRKLATLSAAAACLAFRARGLRRARDARLTGDAGAAGSFMGSTVRSARIDCARAR